MFYFSSFFAPQRQTNITYPNVNPLSFMESFIVTDFEDVVSTSLFTGVYTRQTSTRVLGESLDLQDRAALLHYFMVLPYMLTGSH